MKIEHRSVNGNDVRFVNDGDARWYVVADLCKALGYKVSKSGTANVTDALKHTASLHQRRVMLAEKTVPNIAIHHSAVQEFVTRAKEYTEAKHQNESENQMTNTETAANSIRNKAVAGLVIETVAGEPRILDIDLAKRLGFAEPRMIRKLVKRHLAALDELGPRSTVERVINGGEATEYYLNRKQAVFITAKSDTPDATDITIEVIQKFDAYERGAVAPALPNFTDPVAAARAWAEQFELKAKAEAIAAESAKALDIIAPKAEVYDRIVNTDGLLPLRAIANMLNEPSIAFNKKLQDMGWIYKQGGKGPWRPYRPAVAKGFVTTKTYEGVNSTGERFISEQAVVTPRGAMQLGHIFGVKIDMTAQTIH